MILPLRSLFALTLLAALTPFIFRKPYIGLLCFLFVMLFRPARVWGPPIAILHLMRVIGILTLVAWFLKTRGSESSRFVSAPQNWLVLAFLGIMCMSRLGNGLALFGTDMMSDFVKTVILYFMIVNLIDTEEKFYHFLWVWTAVVSYLAFLGLSKFASGEYWNSVPFRWVQKNGWGGLLAITIPFTVGLFWNTPLSHTGKAVRWLAPLAFLLAYIAWFHEKIVSVALGVLALGVLIAGSTSWRTRAYLERIVAGLSVFVFIAAEVWSGARGGFVTMVTVLGLIFLYEIRKFRKAFLMIPVALGLVLYVTPQRLLDIYNSITNYEDDPSANTRLQAWRTAINMMSQKPLIGVGVGEFVHKYEQYLPKNACFPVRNTHNIFLHVGAETGLIGFLIYLLLFGKSFLDAVRAWSISKRLKNPGSIGELAIYLSITIIGAGVQCLFWSSYHSHLFFILFGLAVAIKKIVERRTQEDMQEVVEVQVPYYERGRLNA